MLVIVVTIVVVMLCVGDRSKYPHNTCTRLSLMNFCYFFQFLQSHTSESDTVSPKPRPPADAGLFGDSEDELFDSKEQSTKDPPQAQPSPKPPKQQLPPPPSSDGLFDDDDDALFGTGQGDTPSPPPLDQPPKESPQRYGGSGGVVCVCGVVGVMCVCVGWWG